MTSDTRGATQTVRLQEDGSGRTATLWIDRPPLNVLDLTTLAALGAALDNLHRRPPHEAPQVLLVRGAGDRAFSAGVAVEDHTPDRIGDMLGRFHGALRTLRALPSVNVAVVRGHCLGGGMELAAACDLVVAAEDATFSQPEIELGCYPPYAAALYPALLGAKRTFDLLLTGRTLNAAEAQGMGLVSRLAPAAELEPAAAALVAELTSKSAAVTRLTKKAIRAGEGDTFETALAECERIYLQELAATEDMEEGIAAFLDKRQPAWQHR